MNPEIYASRRQQLLNQLSDNSIAIIGTAPEVERNGGTHYPYRFDSSFYYLTGFNEPEAVLVLRKGDNAQSILFCRDKDPDKEIWDGYRLGPDAAPEYLAVDQAFSLELLDETLVELMADTDTIYYPIGSHPEWDQQIIEWRNEVQQQVRRGIRAPQQLADLSQLVHQMRRIKDIHEIELMRRAAEISAQAHMRAMRTVRPAQYEYQLEAELHHEFCRHGARFPAYGSIVASGSNACVLHYVDNNKQIADGELILVDAGCELDGYASDITRTFPANGRFNPAQKDVYQLVLDAQLAAIDAAQPGNHWNQPHEAALKVLVQGMVDLKLCQGEVDGIIESGAYRQFYMHRTGHWLGLDVHDVGSYKTDDQAWQPLQAGMALTIEPGCYIRPADNVPPALWNIGVRIEDGLLITADGHQILSEQAVKSVQQIEEHIQQA